MPTSIPAPNDNKSNIFALIMITNLKFPSFQDRPLPFSFSLFFLEKCSRYLVFANLSIAVYTLFFRPPF